MLHHHKKHLRRIHHHTQTTWEWVRHNTTLVALIGSSIAFLIIGLFFIWIATMSVPTIDSFADRKVTNSTKIYNRTGEVVLYDVYENVKRTVIASDQITPDMKHAVIAIEDKEFYNHHGIILKSIIRAGLSQFIPFIKQSGGSTITQQLVKNTLLTQEKSITRKVKEWVLAVKLERVMTKDQILTTYFNEAPYGGTIYGIEEASRAFFGKKASELTLPESAYLAAIPNAPSYYSPYGKNMTRLENRKNLVLKNMLDQGYISETQYTEAKNAQITFRPQQEMGGKALHFIEYIKQYLNEKYGEDVVLNGGLKVVTTLDWELQQFAEETVKKNALENEKDYGATNSALVAIDPKTGGVLAMVGSRDYSDRKIDGAFNVATAGRQPGSSFKPIVYGRAFEKGYFPETVLFDIPTQFGSCGAFDRSNTPPCYAPDNYDGKFLGPIPLRNALAQSRNVPAVKLLALVGLPDALETGKRLGLTTLDKNADRYGLTLVLGGGEVSLLDMTSVYGVFANSGVKNPTTSILEVFDAQGTILESFIPNPEVVMDANATAMLSSVLSDNPARTPLFGASSFFYFGNREVTGKTGTTNSNKDAWVFGYTPSIAVGVWSGNNDNTPMKKGSAISGPAWRAFMDFALAKLPYDRPAAFESFPRPQKPSNYFDIAPVLRGQWAGGESFFVDTISGKLATEYTPIETRKEFVLPNPHSIAYWINPQNPSGPKPLSPNSFGQFTKWEATFQSWIQNNPGIIPPVPQKPSGYDDVHTLQSKPLVTLLKPAPEMVLARDTPTPLEVSIQAKYLIKEVRWYLNDEYLGSSTGNQFTIVPENTNAVSGENELKVVVIDNVYNQGELVTPIVIE